MSNNISKKMDNLTSKDLLYSEILNTSVTEHVQELLQKKKKSCTTFPVQRSSVLGRASKLLQSLKETENDVQNIEIVEEGEPVIDMSVTLIDKDEECEYDSRDEEFEYDSDTDTNEDIENKSKDKKIICCDSDGDISENGSDAKVNGERSMSVSSVSSDSESEVSENESEDNNVVRNILPFSNLHLKDYEKCIKTVINDLNEGTSSDTDGNIQESKMNVLKETNLFVSNFSREQFNNKNSKTVLEGLNNDKFVDSDDELPNEECHGNQEKILEHPKLDMELTSVYPDSKYHNHSHINNLGLSGERKRKLISVIEDEDEQHICLSAKQKRV